MTNKGLVIQYGNVAPEAKESFVPSASESLFDSLHHLQRYNMIFENYANPCELYQTSLNGDARALSLQTANEDLGLWSEQMSGDNGTFATPIMLTLESEKEFTTKGITLTFDAFNNIYATKMKAKWFKVVNGAETLLDEKEFFPTSPIWLCDNDVEGYNKIELYFYSLNMPQNRLRLRSIDYGYGTLFYGNNVRNIRINQEIDPISSKIVISTVDFVLDNKNLQDYNFKAKQPLQVYFNGKLKSTTFIKNSTRKSQSLWDIKSEDYVGVLDKVNFVGGIYLDARAIDVIKDIFNTANVPYKLNADFDNALLSGYIPYTSCRNALMQVAFAIQAVINTSESSVVNIDVLDDETKQTIPLNRIMQGQNFNQSEIVTGVEITAHKYRPISEEIIVYDASESGVGENIEIVFSEPLHDLTITDGEILSSGTNFAIINANTNCALVGQKYRHTTYIKKVESSTNQNNAKNIVSIKDATLVSLRNIDNVLEKCYNWLTRTNSTNLKVVEGKHVEYSENGNVVSYDEPIKLGEVIKVETQYMGVVEGKVIKQSYNLNGGIIVKDTVIK